MNNASSAGASTSTAVFGFDGIPAACSGTPQAGVITTTAMNPASPLCAGSTKALTASNPNGPITGLSYQWQNAAASTGTYANVTGGTGATTLNYTTASLSSTTWFRLAIKCSNSNVTTYSAPYAVLIGAQQPGSIGGRPTSCPGDTATYSVPAVSGNTYAWSLPPGWTGTSTTNSILVTMGSSAGTISVTANGCGGPSIARTKTILAGSAPGQPATISGPDNICAGTSHTYSVAAVAGASSYTWTLPAGWAGASNTNTITVMASSTAGTLKVKASNGCGSSTEAAKSISIITSLASPGTITSSAQSGLYCSGKLYNFSINPVPGATSYSWVMPSGWSGVPAGNTLQAFAGSGGQVQVTAYVSCATSPTASLSTTVTPTVTPAVSVATSAAMLCQGKPVTFSATTVHGGSSPVFRWKKNGANVIATGATYTGTGLVNGDVISVSLASNAACRSTDTVHSAAYAVSLTPSVTPGISINTNPVVKICEGTLLQFNTIRTGGGSAPAYQWYLNGTAVGGAVDTSFSSASLADGDTITVKMTTNAVCAAMPEASSNKVSVIVKDTVHPNVLITASSIVAGEPVTFTSSQTGGGATPDYQWLLNGVELPAATNDTYTSAGLTAGDHISVRMQSYAECAMPDVVMSEELIMQSATSVASAKGWNGTINLFPNPNSGSFTLVAEGPQAPGQRIAIDVYSMIGQAVHHTELRTDKLKWQRQIQLSEGLPNGQYNVSITAEDGGRANLLVTLRR